MKLRMLYHSLLAFALVLVAASLTLAHDVTISERAKLGNGPELNAGTYRLKLVKNQDTSEAVFYKGGDQVARVPITIVNESDKSRHTEVHSQLLDGERVINEIRVAGWKETLVFSKSVQQPAVAE